MRRTPGTPNEHVIHRRSWRGTASATGLLSALLLLASCGSSGAPSADSPSQSEPAPAVERIAEPDPDCEPAPTSLSAATAIEADATDCLSTAPVTITAEVPGMIDLLVDAPATCAVDVLNADESTDRSLSLDSSDSERVVELGAGEGVTLSDADADDGTCRFRVGWTPSPVASTSTTTTVPAPRRAVDGTGRAPRAPTPRSRGPPGGTPRSGTPRRSRRGRCRGAHRHCRPRRRRSRGTRRALPLPAG